MEAAVFAKMAKDRDLFDLARLKQKYPEVDLSEFIQLLYDTFYRTLPLCDESGKPIIYQEFLQIPADIVRTLLTPQRTNDIYGMKAMEEEIYALLELENVEATPDSIRMMLRGLRAADITDKRIKALKKGFEFISAPNNKITEKRINVLYQTVIAPFAKEKEQLRPEQYYRHTNCFAAHFAIKGVDYLMLPQCMTDLVEFMNTEETMQDLLKAALIHFYVLYLQPYFTGNETMARLLASWFLIQRDYPSTLFLSFSKSIEKSRALYENAKKQVRTNQDETDRLDVTPFLSYYVKYVYKKSELSVPVPKNTMEAFKKAQEDGFITERQKDMWDFIVLEYGCKEFTETQLTNSFGRIGGVTVSKYLSHFEKLGLLEKIRYSGHFRYRVK